VIRRLDLGIEADEFVAIIGPSGCGKSTLLSLLAGYLMPSSGRVLFRGEPIAGPGRDRMMVFQQPALFPWLTAADNVAGQPPKRRCIHLREIMGKLKLTVNEDKTRICTVPKGEFDFLGFTFGQMFSRTTGQARLGLRPSKKSIKRVVEKVHELTVRARR
jgi:ABC-type Fe3+/spermidine/putrescine transport system ATPase subunit